MDAALLASLESRVTAVAYEADRAILHLLARTGGWLTEAGRLFACDRSMEEAPVACGSLGWDNDDPPFQWQFFDQVMHSLSIDMRAPSSSSAVSREILDISIM